MDGVFRSNTTCGIIKANDCDLNTALHMSSVQDDPNSPVFGSK